MPCRDLETSHACWRVSFPCRGTKQQIDISLDCVSWYRALGSLDHTDKPRMHELMLAIMSQLAGMNTNARSVSDIDKMSVRTCSLVSKDLGVYSDGSCVLEVVDMRIHRLIIRE